MVISIQLNKVLFYDVLISFIWMVISIQLNEVLFYDVLYYKSKYEGYLIGVQYKFM